MNRSSLSLVASGLAALVTIGGCQSQPDIADLLATLNPPDTDSLFDELFPDAPADEEALPLEIGPEGGRVASTDETLELTVPPGALTTNTQVTVGTVSAPESTGGATVVSEVFNVQLGDDASLSQPVTVSIWFDASRIPSSASKFTVHVARFDSAKGRWLLVPSQVAPGEDRVNAQLDRFSPICALVVDEFVDWAKAVAEFTVSAAARQYERIEQRLGGLTQPGEVCDHFPVRIGEDSYVVAVFLDSDALDSYNAHYAQEVAARHDPGDVMESDVRAKAFLRVFTGSMVLDPATLLSLPSDEVPAEVYCWVTTWYLDQLHDRKGFYPVLPSARQDRLDDIATNADRVYNAAQETAQWYSEEFLAVLNAGLTEEDQRAIANGLVRAGQAFADAYTLSHGCASEWAKVSPFVDAGREFLVANEEEVALARFGGHAIDLGFAYTRNTKGSLGKLITVNALDPPQHRLDDLSNDIDAVLTGLDIGSQGALEPKTDVVRVGKHMVESALLGGYEIGSHLGIEEWWLQTWHSGELEEMEALYMELASLQLTKARLAALFAKGDAVAAEALSPSGLSAFLPRGQRQVELLLDLEAAKGQITDSWVSGLADAWMGFVHWVTGEPHVGVPDDTAVWVEERTWLGQRQLYWDALMLVLANLNYQHRTITTIQLVNREQLPVPCEITIDGEGFAQVTVEAGQADAIEAYDLKVGDHDVRIDFTDPTTGSPMWQQTTVSVSLGAGQSATFYIGAAITAIPGTMVLQLGPGDGKDTMVRGATHTDENYGDYPRLGIGQGSETPVDTLIEFDLSGVGISKVKSAKLQLYAYHEWYSSGETASLYGVPREWEEMTATWLSEEENIGELLATRVNDGINKWYEWEIPAWLVEQWIADPASNHGLRLIDRTYGYVTFYSSDYADDPTLRPKLILEY